MSIHSSGEAIPTRQMKIEQNQKQMKVVCSQLFDLLFKIYQLPYTEKGNLRINNFISLKELFHQLQKDGNCFFEESDPNFLNERTDGIVSSCKKEENKLSDNMIDLDYIQELSEFLPAEHINILYSIIIKQKALTEFINQLNANAGFSFEEKVAFYGIQSAIMGQADSRKQVKEKEKAAFTNFFKALQNEFSESLNRLNDICFYIQEEAERQLEMFSKQSKCKNSFQSQYRPKINRLNASFSNSIHSQICNFNQLQISDDENKDKDMKSYGQYFIPPEQEFDFNGIRNGFGKQAFNNMLYEGNFINYEWSGFGKVEMLDTGNIYEGMFRKKYLNGLGSFTSKKGVKKVGEFRKNKLNGFGIYHFPPYFTYKGEFQEGKFDGFGCKINENGNSYYGQFQMGKRCGYGVEIQLDKYTFKGNWSNDMKNGSGILELTSGTVLKGEWTNDQEWGVFYVKSIDGRKWSEEYTKGICVRRYPR